MWWFLPAPLAPNKSRDPALFDRQIDVVQRADLAVPRTEAFDFQDRRHQPEVPR